MAPDSARPWLRRGNHAGGEQSGEDQSQTVSLHRAALAARAFGLNVPVVSRQRSGETDQPDEFLPPEVVLPTRKRGDLAHG